MPKPPMKKKVVKEVDTTRFAILNHLGEFWSPDTYPDRVSAKEKIDQWIRDVKTIDLSKHAIVPVRVTVTYTPQTVK